jgi:predicted nucleic acid-binding protein
VYFSHLVRLEIAEALKNLAVRRPPQLPAPIRQQYVLDRWTSDAAIRRRWLRFGFSQLEILLTKFQAVVEVPLSLTACARTQRLMADYGMRSYDALHAATARELRLRHFVTTDRGFIAVKALHLWLVRDDA